MATALRRAAGAWSIVLLLGTVSRAASITYTIPDIGDFSSGGNLFSSNDTTPTFTGTGFCGMFGLYWAHVFTTEANVGKTNLQVNIAALKHQPINSAMLQFVYREGSSDTQDVAVDSYISDGVLRHNYSSVQNLLSSTSIAAAGMSANSFDVTSLVRERANAGADWLGLRLSGTTGSQYTYTIWPPSYLNITDPSVDRAQVRLVVDYAPEPVALGLLPAALFMTRQRRPETSPSR